MEKEKNKDLYGLLGQNISYSFSRGYFKEKFKKLNLENSSYVNFDVQSIHEFPDVVKDNINALKGMNVTIPYKEEVFKYLDFIDKEAETIGAVNTIKITKGGKLKGYNTDCIGFEKSLQPLLNKFHKKALILGTGGASKAIAYSLKKLGLSYQFVSRSPKKGGVSYEEIDKEIIEQHTLIINSTPLGTYPDVEDCPNIPYKYIGKQHILYDLIYNPEETTFLNKGKVQGAVVKNGLEMLVIQAEEAWRIWNTN